MRHCRCRCVIVSTHAVTQGHKHRQSPIMVTATQYACHCPILPDAHSHLDTRTPFFVAGRASVAGWLHTVTVAQTHRPLCDSVDTACARVRVTMSLIIIIIIIENFRVDVSQRRRHLPLCQKQTVSSPSLCGCDCAHDAQSQSVTHANSVTQFFTQCETQCGIVWRSL